MPQRLAELEVGDHPVAQRADGVDCARRAAEHLLGQGPDCRPARKDTVGAVLDGDHRRFVQDDPIALDGNERVRSAQIDAEIGAEESTETAKHPCLSVA
jgi:hypothetical protein